jgi:hypothetical protein
MRRWTTCSCPTSGTTSTLYDIDCVQRILDYFMSSTDGTGTGYNAAGAGG